MATTDPPSQGAFHPLPYAPPQRGRPGLLTAVGVLSIIVASISVLGSLSGVGSGVAMMMMSNFPPPAPAAVAAAPGTPTTAAASGNMVFSVTAGTPATASPTGMTGAAPRAMAASLSRFHVDRGASILMIVESLVSLLVAGMLLLAGILIFRDSPRARPLHRWFVILKLPLIVVAGFATWWMYSGMMAGMSAFATAPATPFGGMANLMAVVQVVFRTVISLIYPVALLIVFATRTWREYFNSLLPGQPG